MRRLISRLVMNLLFAIVFIFGCAKHEPVSDDYVMQIKNVGLRPGVFVRRYKLTKDYGSHKEFSAATLEKFIKESLEPDYLLIQHAHDLGLPQETKIAHDIRDYRVNLLASNHPILYEQVTILKEDLHKYYEKKSFKYDLDLVQTNSYNLADSIYKSILAGQKILIPQKEETDFNFPRYQKLKDVIYGEQLHPDVFPELIKMKEGEVSKPFYTIPIWTIIRLNKKHANKDLKPFDQIEKELVSEAQLIYKYEQQRQLVKTLREKYPILVHKDYFQPLIAAYVTKGNRGSIDPHKFTESDLSKTFIHIHQDSISLFSFISSFNQSMQFSALSKLTEIDFNHFVDDYVSQYLMYLDALEKKVDQNELIQDQLVNKENKTLLNRYLNEEIAHKVVISDADAREHHQKNTDKWKAKYEEVASTVKGDLKNKRMLERRDELVKQLRDKYDVRYNKPLLLKIAKELTLEKSGKK